MLEWEPRLLTTRQRLHGPNQWPSSTQDPNWGPKFRDIVTQYTTQLKLLSERLLVLLAQVVGMAPEQMLAHFVDEPHVRMKLVRYPKLSEAEHSLPNVESLFGVGPHKDYGFFGLLLQDDVGGLQYQHNVMGQWIDAQPIPGTFVVTLGEMIEALTDRHFPATVHRVLVPRNSSRQSVNFFYCPRPDAVVSPIPLPISITKTPIAQLDGDPNNVIYNAYGENALKGMCRSHPDVVQAHHPDLLHLAFPQSNTQSA
eukprot:c9466_g1_i3.p1 GENE.c9466_g1_i3~~c9466_g1_i3.p1  ORF type:complete len:255 (+),score=49.39 c9466_g1_i3:231-995(+)